MVGILSSLFGGGSLAYQIGKDVVTQGKFRDKYLKSYWKKSDSLDPEIILGARFAHYNSYYYPRDESDGKIEEAILNKENVLVVGRPLAGKTRAVFEVLKKLEDSCFVIMPRPTNIDIKDFPFHNFHIKKAKILFLDDLHRFAEMENYDYLFEVARKYGLVVVATTRSGEQFDFLKKSLSDKNLQIDSLFDDNIIELDLITVDEAKEIAPKVSVDLKDAEFDGTIGSILMKLAEMRRRYNDLQPDEIAVLHILKNMYFSGIYEENQRFSFDWIKTVAEKQDLGIRNSDWNCILSSLISKELIANPDEDIYEVEEVYLERIFNLGVKVSEITILKEMLSVFSEIPDALIKLVMRSYSHGVINLKISEYMMVSIKACEKVLKVYTLTDFPIQYAAAQNSIGNAYDNLADYEDTKNNLEKAIQAYEEALKVCTFDDYPTQYAATKNNIGNAHINLAGQEDTKNNLQKAIEAYDEALKVFTFDDFRIQYAITQNNIGNAHRSLAGQEDTKNNLQRAIEAYEKALKVHTLAEFPFDYATAWNNLGVVYTDFAKIEDTKNNLQKAIQACEEALKVRTFEALPIQYASTLNNIGNIYCELANIENTEHNLQKAIEAYKKALKVRTLNNFRIYHAESINNLGTAYRMLAELEDTKINLKKAIEAYYEALKVLTLADFPIQYASIQINIGNAYRILADQENKEINLQKAIEAFEKALKVFTTEKYPSMFRLANQHLLKCLD